MEGRAKRVRGLRIVSRMLEGEGERGKGLDAIPCGLFLLRELVVS